MTFEWKAIYNDGSFLTQFNNDRTENKYTDINRSKLSQFILYQFGIPIVIVYLDGNKKLIFRKRVAIHVGVGQEEICIVGWQENRNGTNIQMICFVFEDGHVEVRDRFDEHSKWFYPIQFMKEESL